MKRDFKLPAFDRGVCCDQVNRNGILSFERWKDLKQDGAGFLAVLLTAWLRGPNPKSFFELPKPGEY